MRAIVLGVSGMTGRAAALELAAAGHEVVGTGRSEGRFPAELVSAGVLFVASDRHDRVALAKVLKTGADVVVDCVCYTAEHALMLLEHRYDVGSAVVVSSKAVYVDEQGRHSNSTDPPDFLGPVTEAQPVLAPDFSGGFDSREGYGANKVAAEQVLLNSGWPVSILRPSRIHGVGSARPREWFFVRRILDGRTAVPLARRGQTANHPTAAVNLARLTAFCCEQPGRRVLNVADPGQPTAADVARAVAQHTGPSWRWSGLSTTRRRIRGATLGILGRRSCWTSPPLRSSATVLSAPMRRRSGQRLTGCVRYPLQLASVSTTTSTSESILITRRKIASLRSPTSPDPLDRRRDATVPREDRLPGQLAHHAPKDLRRLLSPVTRAPRSRGWVARRCRRGGRLGQLRRRDLGRSGLALPASLHQGSRVWPPLAAGRRRKSQGASGCLNHALEFKGSCGEQPMGGAVFAGSVHRAFGELGGHTQRHKMPPVPPPLAVAAGDAGQQLVPQLCRLITGGAG
jgi:nucleoside-diphosphate-sugar epimerase